MGGYTNKPNGNYKFDPPLNEDKVFGFQTRDQWFKPRSMCISWGMCRKQSQD